MNGYVSNFIFGTALNVVHPGIPNVLEADLARVSMVGPLLLALAVAVLLLCAFVVERILRTLSMLPPLCRLSIGQAMICLSARSVTERERESFVLHFSPYKFLKSDDMMCVCLLHRRVNH